MSAVADFFTETAMIPALKLLARKHYEGYQRERDSLPCGKALAEHISSSVIEHKTAFNETMEKLAAVDPSCPKFRL